MQRTLEQLRCDARTIWQAAVDAVRSERLVQNTLHVDGTTLSVADERFDLNRLGRIVVIGAGKAGAGMAAAVETTLGPEIAKRKRLTGWVNVPDDCVRRLSYITLHGARPAGVNEPTQAGADGTAEILRLVKSLTPDDLCLALISGGGSALLPAPVDAISLDDKLAVTRHLSAAGASINQLNIVRKQLSRVKGGGLMRACRAGDLVALILSDVLGDPLDVIASGPTVDDSSTPAEALEVLEQFDASASGIASRVFDYLRQKSDTRPTSPVCRVTNRIIGNNTTAVDAAGREAERLGYTPATLIAERSEGPAEEVGRHLADIARSMRGRAGPDCLISGGEPVVKLVESSQRGDGGRNQQLVLAALEHLAEDGAEGLVLLAGGTDGEDGPTDAAGAWIDASVLNDARKRGLDPTDFLERNDAYHFFEPLDALIKTGPTHTNVCDIRVALVQRIEDESLGSVADG